MTAPHGKTHNRRQFFVQTLVGGLVCSLADAGRTLLGAEQQGEKKYDLLVKGGKVVDPSQQLSAVRDVAIASPRLLRRFQKPRPGKCSTPAARSLLPV